MTGGNIMSLRQSIINQVEGKEKTNSNPKVQDLHSTRSPLESMVVVSKLNSLFYLRDELDEERFGLHASSIISSDNDFCIRNQVLSLFYKQHQGEQLPVKSLKIFAAGTSIHEKWQKLFAKGNIATAIEERQFSEEYELFFTPDAVIEVNCKKYVVEIKSMNMFSFQKTYTHPGGRKQLMLYMHLLGIRQGFVLMECKNTQEFKIELVEYNFEEVGKYIDRLNEVQTLKKIYMETQELPPKKCNSYTCKAAKDCNMRDACFSKNGGRIAHGK